MKDDRITLAHIVDSIESILSYVSTGQISFMKEKMRQDAVVRNLEILGEAVKKLSMSLKDKHPDVPWKKIAGMRDKMNHEYFGVDLKLVWDVVDKELPKLKRKIQTLL